MPLDPELHYMSVEELRKAYESRSISPVEVTKAYLERLEQLDGSLHAYTTTLVESSLREAENSETRFSKGEPRGPLDGIPIGLKDVFDTANIRTTANSRLYANRVPTRDATVVRKLREAGAISLGKLSMGEFASGGQGPGSMFPLARNPWNFDHIPGGSSSGPAAAVAAGLCAAALGSDTGGSIRGPAAYCGIVGFKPSAGLVSRFGVIPLAWTLDNVGPMTRSVRDAAIVLEVIAGYDPEDLGSVDTPGHSQTQRLNGNMTGTRIGAPMSLIEAEDDVHPEVMEAYINALNVFKDLGADVDFIDLPDVVFGTSDVFLVIAMSEAAALHEKNVRVRSGEYGSSFLNAPYQGALYSATDYIQAQRARTLIVRTMQIVMQSVDVIAVPTKSEPAPTPSQEANKPHHRRKTALRRLFSLTGQPAISIPCGFSSKGLPLGLQCAGRLFHEHQLLNVAYAFEQATDWRSCHPPIDDRN